MTVPGHSPIYDDEERFDMPALWRLGLWAIAAAVAVGLVVMAGYTDAGSQRVRLAWATVKAPPEGTRGLPPASFERPDDTDRETRRLAQQVRGLSADRERLIARLDALEKSFEDVTGSIARQPSPPRADLPHVSPAPEPASAPAKPDATTVPAPDIGWAASVAQPATLHEPPEWPMAARPGSGAVAVIDPATANPPAPATTAVTRTEFGVDIGGGATVSAMRALWLSIRGSHPALLDGLRPVLTIRDGPRGATELRLIAGPLVNAGAAARLCGSLGAAGLTCQPAVFDGQRLATR
jgi:hypothetical protein